jgi:hypothetical protein
MGKGGYIVELEKHVAFEEGWGGRGKGGFNF